MIKVIKGTLKEIETFQNEDKGTTVAIIKDTHYDVEREVERRLGKDDYSRICERMPENIKAKTTLSAGDAWDDEYGEKRAVKKALVTRSKLVKNGIKNVVHRLIKDAIQLDKDEAYWFMNDELTKRNKR